MTPARFSSFPRRCLLLLTLLGGASFSTGCGSDGAGTIHIESPKARRQMMQTGGGNAATATGKPGATGTVPKPPAHSTIKSHASKKR
jgi:hypothetical protein